MVSRRQRDGMAIGSLGLVLSCVLVISVVPAQEIVSEQPAETEQLLPNPRFADNAEGWLLREAHAIEGAGHDGSGIVQIDPPGDPANDWTHVGVLVDPVPVERALEFSVYARADTAGMPVGINAFVYGDDRELLDSFIVKTELESVDWQRITSSIVAPPGARKLTIWIINKTAHPILVSSAACTAAGAAKAQIKMLRGPGVILASAAAEIAANTEWRKTAGTVTFPIPLLTEHQVPLTFELEVTPERNLRGFRWIEREDGVNLLAEIRIMPSRKPTNVRWKSLVLVAKAEEHDLLPASTPEINDENRRWLRSTACVQSDDPKIVELAAEMAEQDADIAEYANTVIIFTARNKGEPGVLFDTLDASKALSCGGSCTSRANLAAALLRANGIPARTQAHLPTWSGPLYLHWLVEYWHPGVGWVWLESSKGQMQPATCSLVTINVANPEDEDLAFSDELTHSGVMLGAPYLAVHNISGELERTFGGSDNWAEVVTPLAGEAAQLDRLFLAARSHFTTLSGMAAEGEIAVDRQARIAEAIAAGTVPALLSALE